MPRTPNLYRMLISPSGTARVQLNADSASLQSLGDLAAGSSSVFLDSVRLWTLGGVGFARTPSVCTGSRCVVYAPDPSEQGCSLRTLSACPSFHRAVGPSAGRIPSSEASQRLLSLRRYLGPSTLWPGSQRVRGARARSWTSVSGAGTARSSFSHLAQPSRPCLMCPSSSLAQRVCLLSASLRLTFLRPGSCLRDPS